jgi:hypothetical protein
MTPQQIKTGRRWAYGVMLAMLALSIAGNVSHTYHLDATPSARMLAYGLFWPLIAWGAVELFVRIPWQDIVSHKLVRWGGVLLAGLVAALVSYRHLRGLLQADGEEWTVYTIGPLAVDGLMIMSTLALLLTRAASPIVDRSAEIAALQLQVQDRSTEIDRLLTELADAQQAVEARDALTAVHAQPQLPEGYTIRDGLPAAPVSPAPAGRPLVLADVLPQPEPLKLDIPGPVPLPGWTPVAPAATQAKRSTGRAKTWDETKARELLAQGKTKAEVAEAVGVDPKTIQRLKARIAKEQASV